MKRIIFLVCLVIVLVGSAVLGRYASWALNWENAETPFDEVGISLHQMMPAFIQAWGCEHLKAEFAQKTMPPHGCRAEQGRGWR
ncbi:MAG: hypothetical protein ACK5JT_03575 [Hyphomicrobiaceae bacterium]